ncbi:MAG: carbohydrate-binding domain-containing protein [Eubacterium sp.]|nr:carbohydrate-binding domain-containing protein [Eubacterium sp.]
MKKKRFIAVICAAALLCGCVYDTPTSDTGDSRQESSAVVENSTNGESGGGEASSDNSSDSNDARPTQGTAVTADCTITFNGDSAQSGGNVDINGSTVTITEPGVYELSGSSDNGQVIVDAKGSKVTLILNGLSLTCTDNAPIFCKKAKLFTLTLADGSQNVITDGESYNFADGEDEPDAAIFSKSDMIINGSGSLTVNASYNDAIKSKDTLEINGGNLNLNSADDGIIGKDYLKISGGSLVLDCGGDGLKSTKSDNAALGYILIDGGAFDITAGSDAVQAETDLTVNGGEFKVVTSGGSAGVVHTDNGGFGGGRFDGFSMGGDDPFDFDSMTDSSGNTANSTKAFKAGGKITVNGGTFNIDSADDAFHSVNVTVKGGTFEVATGDDAFHADEKMVISGGDINITSSYEGIEGMSIEISGGNISLVASDDGLNAAGGDNAGAWGYNPGGSDEYYINISGGNIVVNAQGDGIDSNGSVTMSGGTVIVYGPTNGGNGALDYDRSFDLTGGTLIALGAVGMAEAPSSSTQPCHSFTADVSANTEITVKDSSGNTVLSTVTPKNCRSIIISSPDLVAGSEYTVYGGDSVLTTFTAENGVTGSTGGMGGFGGPGGGMPGGDFGGPGGGGFGGRPGR